MRILRKAATQSRNKREVDLGTPIIVEWNKSNSYIALTSKPAGDFNTRAHYYYCIQLSAHDIQLLLACLGNAALEDPEEFESWLIDANAALTRLFLVANRGQLNSTELEVATTETLESVLFR